MVVSSGIRLLLSIDQTEPQSNVLDQATEETAAEEWFKDQSQCQQLCNVLSYYCTR